jgi:polyvinyl alcohol dehydrogenase (cytochrome)
MTGFNRWRRHLRQALTGVGVAAMLLAGCTSSSPGTAGAQVGPTGPGPFDWPTYGHDAQHTFHGRTTLTAASAKRLKVAWFFPTGDAVTATPTVVDGTVYVGSWDDYFYALNLETGTMRWRYKLRAQDAVTPYPGQNPRDVTSDGGLVTSSAWYQPGDGTRPDLVIFGGGYTLYALNASTGALYWRHNYAGRPGRPNPDVDGTRIFSSPVVVGDKVLFGVDVDGQNGYVGSVVAADLDTGDPDWVFQTNTDSSGHVLYNGCGSVWSSGTVLPRLGTVVFATADCDFSDSASLSESIIALQIGTGKLAWAYHPPLPALDCDWDFGATPNAGVTAGGAATFLGAGSKDGTYYSLDPVTGRLRWATNVVFGGFAGGFIATTAYDGHRVYGSTALGDFGNFEKDTQVLCDPSNPRDTSRQEPTVHSFDAATGTVAWQADGAASFAPTTVAGGMTFNGPAIQGAILQVRRAATGSLVTTVPVPGPIWSGIATVGDALVTGIGSSYVAQPAGVAVVTPGGAPPVVPGSSSSA